MTKQVVRESMRQCGKTLQQRTDRLAEWAKLKVNRTRYLDPSLTWIWKDDKWQVFDPFTDLNHARLLLEKCARDGLQEQYVAQLHRKIRLPIATTEVKYHWEVEWDLVSATAEQQTEAVEAVAGYNEQEDRTEKENE